ncbi:MAG: hypothetical protein U5N58_00795 [Actinomycetota bacterium]|nr:hypothetical protein [Actinomycetota bacterium]
MGLGLASQKDKQDLKVNIPSFRYEDLEREIDLVEEVARIYGFNNFKSRPPQITQRPQGYSPGQKAERRYTQLPG